MAELAWCQPHRDMTTQGNPLQLTPPLHTCCCVCLHAEGETPAILSEEIPQIVYFLSFWRGGGNGRWGGLASVTINHCHSEAFWGGVCYKFAARGSLERKQGEGREVWPPI